MLAKFELSRLRRERRRLFGRLRLDVRLFAGDIGGRSDSDSHGSGSVTAGVAGTLRLWIGRFGIAREGSCTGDCLPTVADPLLLSLLRGRDLTDSSSESLSPSEDISCTIRRRFREGCGAIGGSSSLDELDELDETRCSMDSTSFPR